MENNINNKAKFFAQYHGQNIVCDGLAEGDTCSVEYAFSESIYVEAWLELKPLSEVTEDHAKELLYRLGSVIDMYDVIHKNSTDVVRDIIDNYSKVECLWMLPARFVDKARELGYAIDWNGLSVEEQVSRGWVQLKEN